MEQIARLRRLLDLAGQGPGPHRRPRREKRSGYILIKRKIDPEARRKGHGPGHQRPLPPGREQALLPPGNPGRPCPRRRRHRRQRGWPASSSSITGSSKARRASASSCWTPGGGPTASRPSRRPSPGQDLRLTIDETIQYIAETELEKAVAACGADWGTVVIIEPRIRGDPGPGQPADLCPDDYPPEARCGAEPGDRQDTSSPAPRSRS